MLAVVVKFVLVWRWFWDIFWVNMGGVRRRMVDAGSQIVGVGLHHTLGFTKLCTEGRVRERCARAKTEEGKFSDGHRGSLCGLMAALKVRIKNRARTPKPYSKGTGCRSCRVEQQRGYGWNQHLHETVFQSF